MVTLGLGSPSRSVQSLEQLAVQTALRERFGIKTVVCFDPVFNADDAEALSKLDCIVDSYFENYITGECLFFMPHCDKEIYIDVIKRRLNVLHQTTIIGNSFLLYEQNTLGSDHVFWRNLNSCVDIKPFTVTPDPEHNSLSDTKLITFKHELVGRVAQIVNQSE